MSERSHLERISLNFALAAAAVDHAKQRVLEAENGLQQAEAAFTQARQQLEIGTRSRVLTDGPRVPLLPGTRQFQVLEMVRRGWSNKEIGSSLGISERTAKFHVSNLLVKFAVSDRRQLMLLPIMLPAWPALEEKLCPDVASLSPSKGSTAPAKRPN